MILSSSVDQNQQLILGTLVFLMFYLIYSFGFDILLKILKTYQESNPVNTSFQVSLNEFSSVQPLKKSGQSSND